MKYAIENYNKELQFKYIGWTDFGAIRTTKVLPEDREFFYEPLKNNKYNLRSFLVPEKKHCDYIYLVLNMENRFSGGF